MANEEVNSDLKKIMPSKPGGSLRGDLREALANRAKPWKRGSESGGDTLSRLGVLQQLTRGIGERKSSDGSDMVDNPANVAAEMHERARMIEQFADEKTPPRPHIRRRRNKPTSDTVPMDDDMITEAPTAAADGIALPNTAKIANAKFPCILKNGPRLPEIPTDSKNQNPCHTFRASINLLKSQKKQLKRKKCKYKKVTVWDEPPPISYRIDVGTAIDDEHKAEKKGDIREIFPSQATSNEKKDVSEFAINKKYLKPPTHATTKKLFETKDDVDVFTVYQDQYDKKANAESQICKRQRVLMWEDEDPSKLLTEAISMKIGPAIGPIEPFYATLALFDIKKKKGRISEDFHFDFNQPDVLSGVLTVSRDNADEITLAKHAIFTIVDRHEGIHFILTLHRVLQGISPPGDSYLKEKNATTKTQEKYSKQIRNTITKMGAYRQPYAIGVFPLFDETGELVHGDGHILVERLYPYKGCIDDIGLCQLTSDIRAHPSQGAFPDSYFRFGLCEIDSSSQPSNRVDPSHFNLADTDDILQITDDEAPDPIIKEIQPLGSGMTKVLPSINYVNNLYVYPISMAFKKHRNICVKVELRNDDIHKEAISVVYGRSSTFQFVPWQILPVTYHSYNALWNEEVKLKLPENMTVDTHLFFTFVNTSVGNAQKNKDFEENIGYAVLPIFTNGYVPITNEPVSLHVYETIPNTGYLKKFREKSDSGAHPTQFKLSLTLVSTVQTTDPHVAMLFEPMDKKSLTEKQTHLATVAIGLRQAKHEQLIRFLCPIMNHLFNLLIQEDLDIQLTGFKAINYVVERIHSNQSQYEDSHRCTLLAAYVNNVYTETISDIPVYLSVAKNWAKALNTDGFRPDEFLMHGWWWLDVMVKSLSLERQLIDEGKRDVTTASGSQAQFHRALQQILESFWSKIQQHRDIGLIALKNLNNDIALFLSDAFSIIHKTMVLKTIRYYLNLMMAGEDPVILDMKCTFFQVILDNHWIVDMSAPRRLTDEELKKGDVVDLVKRCFPLPGMIIHFINENIVFHAETIRGQVIDVLRNLLTKHAFDERYQTKESKELVAVLYFPLIPMCTDNVDSLSAMPSEMQKNLLICVAHILQWMPRKIIRAWWINIKDVTTHLKFIQLLQLVLRTFKYSGYKIRKEEKTFTSILSPESATLLLGGEELAEVGSGATKAADMKRQLEQMYKGNMPNIQGSLRRQRSKSKSLSASTLRSLQSSSTSKTISSVYLVKVCRMEAWLNEMVARTIISVLTDYMEDNEKYLTPEPSPTLMNALLNFMSAYLRYPHSDRLYLILYGILRFFAGKYGYNIFLQKKLSDDIGVFCRELLHHFTFKHAEMRSSAVSVFYHVAKQNFRAVRNLHALRESITVSLFKIVSELEGSEADNLQNSLLAISGYAKQDSTWTSSKDSETFLFALEETLARPSTILSCTLELDKLTKVQGGDPAALEELLISMADAHKHLPVVRINWLRRLADVHRQNDNFAEEGQLYLMISQMKLPGLESGRLERKATMSRKFTFSFARKFTQLLPPEQSVEEENYQKACAALQKGELFEQCIEVYCDVLIPSLRKNKNYNALSISHANLHKIYIKLQEAERKQSRMFGTYYRVAFFGKKFGELTGQKYIYKFPKITRLSEVVTRLKELYESHLGCKIEHGSVQPTDESKEMIQINHVSPHFTKEEEKSREGYYPQNTNLSKFMFSQPYYPEGKKAAENDPRKQQKRIFYCQVSHPFPWISTRQRIVKEQVTTLSPIENGIELLKDKISEFEKLLSQPSLSQSTLTCLIQGSVSPQVHAGPTAFTQAFLGPDATDPPELLETMRKTLKDFLFMCRRGLSTNSALCKKHMEALLISVDLEDDPNKSLSIQASAAVTSQRNLMKQQQFFEEQYHQLMQQMAQDLHLTPEEVKMASKIDGEEFFDE